MASWRRDAICATCQRWVKKTCQKYDQKTKWNDTCAKYMRKDETEIWNY